MSIVYTNDISLGIGCQQQRWGTTKIWPTSEIRRNPDEIAKLIRDAEGKVSALTEVIGGTCTVGNMCPVKFACIGCSRERA
jgi:hypothetical protein